MKKKLESKRINHRENQSSDYDKLLQELISLGYSQENLLINSNFLGANGQVFDADIIVFPENYILHIDPIIVIKLTTKSKNVESNWLNYWKNSGAKILIFKNKNSLKIFALNNSGSYEEIPPFIPSLEQIQNLSNRNNYRLKSTLLPGYNLKNILANIHDYLYGNSNIRIPSRLGIEIQKLLLIKKFDEEQVGETCEFCITPRKLLNKDNNNNISHQENINQVAKKIKNLVKQYNLKKNNKENHIDNLELDDESIYYTVFNLEGISLTKTPSDVLGDALEAFRSYVMKREGGQFFTPRPVIELALNLVKFEGKSGQKLADISCGTSGFLHQARKIIIESFLKNVTINHCEQNQLISDLLLGIEVDKDLVKISNTSPEFEKLHQKIVENYDSLLPFSQWKSQLLKRIQPNSQMFMVGNPPFGTKISIKNQEILESFELARQWKKNKNKWIISAKIVPRSLDILFIERNIQLLKPQIGKMVLVVPYQILSGPREAFVREWLMIHCRIIAVVDLPEDTFQPYTGTKGSLLVVQKREKPNPSWENESEYSIFMARPEKIGHDRRGKPIFKDNKQCILDIDLPEITKAYDEFLQGNDPNKITQKSFIVSSKSITHGNGIRLNAGYYEPKSSNLKQQLITINQNNPEFTISPLGDLVDKIFYPGRFKRDYTDDIDNSVPFLGGSNITQLIPITQKRILKSSSHYNELALKAGWILITRSGTTGIVATVPQDWEGFAASEHIIRIVPDPNKLSSGYLYGYLKSKIGQRLLKDGIFGSVIDEISCNHISSIPVLYPKNSEKTNKIGEQIMKADLLRYQASELIRDTTDTIESFIF